MKMENIKDIDKFFSVVDSCKGKVELVTEDGEQADEQVHDVDSGVVAASR